jgi:hypothetical protein
MASNRILIPIKDGNGKQSTVTAPCGSPTDVQITTFYAAIDLITLGKRQGASLVTETAKEAPDTGLAPANATRNNKWLCTYQDTVDASIHHLEIPTADLLLQATPSNAMDLTTGSGATFKAAFDAMVKSPVYPGQAGGTAVVLLSVEAVGRSLDPS